MTDKKRSVSPIIRVYSELQQMLTPEQCDQIFPLINSAVVNDEQVARQQQEHIDFEDCMDVDDPQLQATIFDTQRLEEIQTDEAIARQLQDEEYSRNSLAPFHQSNREPNNRGSPPYIVDPYEQATFSDRALAEHLQAEENQKRKAFRRQPPPPSTRIIPSTQPEVIPVPFLARPASANPSSNGNNNRSHNDISNLFQALLAQPRRSPGSRRPNDRGAGNLQSTTEDFGPEHYETLLGLDDAVGKKNLSKEQINNLPTEKFRRQAQPNDDENKCSICMEQFEQNQTLRRLKCLHLYHKDCIDRWLPKSNLCPVCRIPQ